MELTIQNHTTERKWNRYRSDFLAIINQTKQVLNLKDEQSMSVIFVCDDEIQEINHSYRNKNQPTDVISFAMMEGEIGVDFTDLEGVQELGDVFINIDAVYRQSKDYGHTIRREVCFLFTHGLLHLLGFDHMNEIDEKKMFGLQDEILSDLVPKRARRHA